METDESLTWSKVSSESLIAISKTESFWIDPWQKLILKNYYQTQSQVFDIWPIRRVISKCIDGIYSYIVSHQFCDQTKNKFYTTSLAYD